MGLFVSFMYLWLINEPRVVSERLSRAVEGSYSTILWPVEQRRRSNLVHNANVLEIGRALVTVTYKCVMKCSQEMYKFVKKWQQNDVELNMYQDPQV